MGVTTPDTTLQESEAEREARLERERLQKQRYTDIARYGQQYLDLTDLIQRQDTTTAAANEAERQRRSLLDKWQAETKASEADRNQVEMNLAQMATDRTAQQTRANAEAKQKAVTDAYTGVDQAFGGYDDSFFENFANEALQTKLPQIRAQAEESQRQATLKASDRGIRQSSAAARRSGMIQGDEANQEAGAANDASNATASLRSTIDAQRSAALTAALQGASIKQNVPVLGANADDIAKAFAGLTPSPGNPAVTDPKIGLDPNGPTPGFSSPGAGTSPKITVPNVTTPAVNPPATNNQIIDPTTGQPIDITGVTQPPVTFKPPRMSAAPATPRIVVH